MKVEQLLKFNSAIATEIVLRNEDYTRVATIDYDMNRDETTETSLHLHIDADNKFYGTNVVLPEEVKKLTVDFFLDSKIRNHKGVQCDGIRIYCKCPKKLK